MFKKAVRSQAKLKLAITGPSGAGKTYSALRLARGISPTGKIAVIDTENNSASLYSDGFEFDSCAIEPPYTIDKYTNAIRFAEKNGYDVVVVDSLSHAWAGEGGLLQQKEQLDARGGNSYTNWAKMTPLHEKFIAALLHSKIHVIGTMRSKQDYVMQENKSGKQAPVKVGLAPVQRDGLEYEFTTVFDVAMNHEAIASKDRTGLFDGKIITLTEEHGKVLKDWMEGGQAVVQDEASGAPAIESSQAVESKSAIVPKDSISPIQPAIASSPQPQARNLRAELVAMAKKKKWTNENVTEYIGLIYGVDSSAQLSQQELYELLTEIESHPPSESLLGARSIRNAQLEVSNNERQ